MNRFACVSIAVPCAVLMFLGIRSVPASAQAACTYECAFYDSQNGYAYFMRSDGVLVRLHLDDKTILEFPNAAPAGRYIALIRESNNPFLNGLIAVREDGAAYFFSWSSLNNVWQVFTALPSCAPVPVSPSTIGNVKSKYR